MRYRFLFSFILQLFLTYDSFGQNSSADSLISQLASIDSIRSPLEYAELEKSIGDQFFSSKQYHEAYRFFRNALDKYDQLKMLKELGYCSHMLGNINYFLAEYEKSIPHYLKAIESKRQLDDKKGQATSLNNLANAYLKLGDYANALKYYEQSVAIKEILDDAKGIASTVNNIATIYYFQNNYPESLAANFKALAIYESLDDFEGISFVYNNIALNYERQGKLEEALNYYLKSFEIKESLGDKQSLAISLNNIGMLNHKLGDSKLGLQQLESSLALSEELEDQEGISAALNNIGLIFQDSGEYERAVVVFQKSLEIDESTQNKRGILMSTAVLSNIFRELGDFSQAERFTDRGIRLAEELGAKEELSNLHLIRAEIEEAKGNYKSALFHLRQHKIYSDSTKNLEIERDLAKIEAEFEYDKKLSLLQAEQRAVNLEKENEIQTQKFRNNLLWVILCGLVIITILILNYYIKQKKSKKELELRSLALEEANEVKSKLFGVIGHDLRNPLAGIHMLLGLYNRKSINETDFREVLPGLYANIGAVLETLNNLLQWSMREMDMLQSKPEMINLKEVVDEISSFVSTISGQKNIQIKNLIDKDLEVFFDQDHLQLVLRNLISNSIKFSHPDSSIEVKSFRNKEGLVLFIRDFGVGMSKEEIDSLFKKRPVKGKNGTVGEIGTGLGLSLVQYHVESSGGKIWVESQEGTGSSFFILFADKKCSDEQINIKNNTVRSDLN